MGKVEYFDDETISEEEVDTCKALFLSLETKSRQFIDVEIGNQEVEDLLQRKPAIAEGAISVGNSALLQEYSFWLASALPLSSNLMYYLLKTKSTCERLESLDRLFSQGLQGRACAMPPASSA